MHFSILSQYRPFKNSKICELSYRKKYSWKQARHQTKIYKAWLVIDEPEHDFDERNIYLEEYGINNFADDV